MVWRSTQNRAAVGDLAERRTDPRRAELALLRDWYVRRKEDAQRTWGHAYLPTNDGPPSPNDGDYPRGLGRHDQCYSAAVCRVLAYGELLVPAP